MTDKKFREVFCSTSQLQSDHNPALMVLHTTQFTVKAKCCSSDKFYNSFGNFKLTESLIFCLKIMLTFWNEYKE